ncbi:hypothetical protein [Acidovorax sp.]|nr:hypothetical protein [Acidovorax sp.]MBN9626565.1 hypothetical protein [Acidovorax sp.]
MSQHNPQNQHNTPSSQRQSPAGPRNDTDTHAQGRDQKQQGSRDSHKSQP